MVLTTRSSSSPVNRLKSSSPAVIDGLGRAGPGQTGKIIFRDLILQEEVDLLLQAFKSGIRLLATLNLRFDYLRLPTESASCQ